MTDKPFVQRLWTVREVIPAETPKWKQSELRRWANDFAAELLADAMVKKLCSPTEALAAVYVTGLYHGAMLGPRHFPSETKP